MPTINVRKRHEKAAGRPAIEKHARLIAFLCSVGLFLFLGIFLLVDAEKVEKRDAALAASGAVVPAPAPATVSSRGDTALPQTDALTQTEPPSPAPAPAEDASQALNETLKAALLGDWARVDELIGQNSASASAGSSKVLDNEFTDQGKQAIAAGDYGKAAEALSAAVSAHPEDADALNQLAFALLREGKIEEAQLQVTRSLSLAPAHAATWANAAEIMAERDNPVASQAALRVAVHLTRDPERALRFLKQADRSVASAKFRAVIGEVLPEFGNIPHTRSGTP